MERQHHLTFVVEPECKYLEHLRSGETGLAMCVTMMSVIEETNSKDSLLAIGADSTAVNMGKHNGMKCHIELHMNRPLQWKICQFHFAELPARKLFEKIDIKTDGLKVPGGSIGKAI